MNKTDKELLELGYWPEDWRKMVKENYEKLNEDVIFYEGVVQFIPDNGKFLETKLKIKSYIPWEGQRP